MGPTTGWTGRAGLGFTAAATILAFATPATGQANAGAAGQPAVPLSACWSNDGSAPTFGSPVFSPSTADVTDAPTTVTISLPLEDPGAPGTATGVTSATIHFLDQQVRLHKSSGTRWTGTITVPRRTAAGQHRITGVEAVDGAGNVRNTLNDGFAHPQLDAELSVVSTPMPTPRPQPRPTALTVSNKKVNVKKKARKVSFQLTVDESEAKVDKAVVRFNSLPARVVTLRRTATGFTGAAKVARGWPGTYKAKVQSLELVDEYGNHHFTYAAAVRNRLGAVPVKVVGRKDKGTPRLVSAKLTPKKFNVRKSARKVTVTVRARDKVSGVKQVRAFIGEHTHVNLKKVKGSRKAGTWRGKIKVTPCDTAYKQSRIWLQLEDRAGRTYDGKGPKFTMKANDVTRPATRLLEPRRPRLGTVEGPIRLGFTENVTGVNASSLVVLHRDGLHWGSRVEGGLTCLKPNGAGVDCSSTKVREVLFTPVPGVLAPDENYGVFVNPDGNLDIRDKAGNPARRSELHFGTFGPS